MKKLRYYGGAIIILFVFIAPFLGNPKLPIIGFLIFLCYIILDSFFEILEIRKSEKIDAMIVSFEDNKNIEYSEIVKHNYLLTIEIMDKRYDSTAVKVYAFLFKKPQNGQKVKVMVRDGDISKTQLFKGDEISDQLLKIVMISLTIVFGVVFYFKFTPLKTE
jgi:hypothetical protein